MPKQRVGTPSGAYAPLAVPAWAATTVYLAGQEALDPSGNLIVRIANGTSRATYDATEQALWKTGSGGGVTATVDGTTATSLAITTGVTAPDIGAAYASITWQALTNYKQNQLVYQSGNFYYANADFTSGASFNAANWTQIVLSSPVYEQTPPDFGWAAWNGKPFLFAGSVIPTTGQVQVMKVKVPITATITNVMANITSAGSTLSNCFAGIYDSSGTQLGVTADQSTSWQSAGMKTMALAGGPVVLTGGTTVWVAFVVGGATTGPTFAKSGSGSSTTVNGSKSGASAWFGSILTGQTSLPSTITPTSIAASSNTLWAGLS